MNTYSNIQEFQQVANKYGIGNVFKSYKIDKKYMVKTPDETMVHFGASGYADYTAHKDNERRKRFRTRNHKWASAKKWSPSWLSYYLLW